MENIVDFEDDFLNTLKNNEEKIKVYVVNGVCLEGIILSHNKNSVSIYGKLGKQIIYKTNIISISKKLYDSYKEHDDE